MRRREPDWDELRRIGQRAESASEAGHLDYEAWRSFLAEADKACNGYPEFSEFLFHYLQTGWLARLRSEPDPKVAAKPPGAARSK